MKLTEHFTLEEFTRSDIAARAGISNAPPTAVIERLAGLARALELVRSAVRAPLIIHSGYRCKALNLLVPGSSPTSAHVLGYAADFTVEGIPVLELCQMTRRTPGLAYDQIIYEYGAWCHLSIDPRAREELWTKKSGEPYKRGLLL